MSPEFSPIPALLGGALIGLSATTMLLLLGRIAGISGIVSGLLEPRGGDLGWRAAFTAGLLSAGLIAMRWLPETLDGSVDRPLPLVILAGLLVGFGTRLGNGCTSGHGVCGLSRRSPRSLASVLTFMAMGFLVASVIGGLT
jgi:uncharacterized membrane protein YedE/YeeE